MAKVSKSLVLPPAIGSYVSLFTPRDPPEGSQGKPRYGLVLMYPKSNAAVLDGLKAAVREVAISKWGAKGPGIVEKMRYAVIADGDERYPDDPAFKGMLFVRASSVADPRYRPPQVVDGQRQPVLSDEDAYSGCTFRVSVRLYPYNKAGNTGVGVGLNNVQVVKKGPRLDGRKSAEEEFDAVEPEASDLM